MTTVRSPEIHYQYNPLRDFWFPFLPLESIQSHSPVRCVQEISPNSLRRPTPVHKTPFHNVYGLSGRGMMTLEYSGGFRDGRNGRAPPLSAVIRKFQGNKIVYSPIRRQEFLRRWTVSLELSASYIRLRDRDISLVQFKTFLKTLLLV